MDGKIIIQQVGYEFGIIETFSDENEEDTLGYIDFYQQYDDGKYNIKHIRTWSVPDKVKSNNPCHIKETLKWLIGLFVNDEVKLVEYIVAEENPVYFACRAFCDVMGGKKSEKIIFERENERLYTTWKWIEFIIDPSGFKDKNYEGSIDDIVKTIAHETNILKRKYKNIK